MSNFLNKKTSLIAGFLLLTVNTSALSKELLGTNSQLSEGEIQRELVNIPGWTIRNQQLYCTYSFANFVEAIEFVNQLVQPSESLAHHPDLEIVYNRVSIRLTTHDAGGITSKDFDLARTISQLAATNGNNCADF